MSNSAGCFSDTVVVLMAVYLPEKTGFVLDDAMALQQTVEVTERERESELAA